MEAKAAWLAAAALVVAQNTLVYRHPEVPAHAQVR
jgi:hypothetical protein